MIIFNHCKESSEIIQRVLHKKPLASILYAEGIRAVTKYCGTVIHSLQQHKYSVGRSGCHKKIVLFFQAYLLHTEAKSYSSLRNFFFQPVKSLMKAKGKFS